MDHHGKALALAALRWKILVVERAAGALRVRQIDARRLPVSAAFHSPLVSEAEAPLAKALKGIELADGTVPVYANTTGAPYPAEAKKAEGSQCWRPP